MNSLRRGYKVSILVHLRNGETRERIGECDTTVDDTEKGPCVVRASTNNSIRNMANTNDKLAATKKRNSGDHLNLNSDRGR